MGVICQPCQHASSSQSRNRRAPIPRGMSASLAAISFMAAATRVRARAARPPDAPGLGAVACSRSLRQGVRVSGTLPNGQVGLPFPASGVPWDTLLSDLSVVAEARVMLVGWVGVAAPAQLCLDPAAEPGPVNAAEGARAPAGGHGRMRTAWQARFAWRKKTEHREASSRKNRWLPLGLGLAIVDRQPGGHRSTPSSCGSLEELSALSSMVPAAGRLGKYQIHVTPTRDSYT